MSSEFIKQVSNSVGQRVIKKGLVQNAKKRTTLDFKKGLVQNAKKRTTLDLNLGNNTTLIVEYLNDHNLSHENILRAELNENGKKHLLNAEDIKLFH